MLWWQHNLSEFLTLRGEHAGCSLSVSIWDGRSRSNQTGLYLPAACVAALQGLSCRHGFPKRAVLPALSCWAPDIRLSCCLVNCPQPS